MQDMPCVCRDVVFGDALPECMMMICTPKHLLSKKNGYPLQRFVLLTNLAAANASYTECGIKSQDQSALFLAVPGVFGGLATLMVLIRVFIRIPSKTFGADDSLVVVAMVRCIPGFLFWPLLTLHVQQLLASPLNWICIPSE